MFKPEGSRGEALLRQLCPQGELSRRSLYSVVSILSAITGIPLERDMTRRKGLLVKWLDQHCDFVEPFLKFIELDQI
jgi:hypothetical protein